MSAATATVLRSAVQPGIYRDSLVLMQLQQRLTALDGIEEAGAAMATAANLELLAATGLLPEPPSGLHDEDLLVVVRATDAAAADAALGRLDALLSTRATVEADSFLPRSLDGALSQRPDSRWVLVSVPGRWAPGVTEDALERGLNVFLYSDNVSASDEARLKRLAAARGLLVLGPDCGTAIVAGTGLGFANHVRRGPIGLVGGSGTGLQAVSVGIHRLGGGVSQAIGTGGHDLSDTVGGITTRQALALLAADSETRVVALVSKSPSPAVAARALDWAADCAKPVVVYFQGYLPTSAPDGVHCVDSLSAVVAHSMALATGDDVAPQAHAASEPSGGPVGGYLRGLFAGGTLAAEALLQLGGRLAPLASNVTGGSWRPLADLFTSRGHTVLDLGADELTRGRLHPMIDQEIRLRRLQQEAADPDVALIVLDVVLGEGAHPDPAVELAPEIETALAAAGRDGRSLEIVTLVVGTEDDPQNLDEQVERLRRAGARVVFTVEEALWPADRLADGDPTEPLMATASAARLEEPAGADPPLAPVPARAIEAPLAAVNVGLESFHDSLRRQGAGAIHVDWRPPAGGNEHLAGILERMRAVQRPAAEETQR